MAARVSSLALAAGIVFAISVGLCEGGSRPLRGALECNNNAQCEKACGQAPQSCLVVGPYGGELSAEERSAALKDRYTHLYYSGCPNIKALIGKVSGGVLRVKPMDRNDPSVHVHNKYCLEMDLTSGKIADIQEHESCPKCGASDRSQFAVNIAQSLAVKMGLSRLTAKDYAAQRCDGSAMEMNSSGGRSLLSVLKGGKTFLEQLGFTYGGSEKETFLAARQRLAALTVGNVITYMTTKQTRYKAALKVFRSRRGSDPSERLGDALSKVLKSDCVRYDEFMVLFEEAEEGAPWYGDVLAFLVHLHEGPWVKTLGPNDDSESSESSDDSASSIDDRDRVMPF